MRELLSFAPLVLLLTKIFTKLNRVEGTLYELESPMMVHSVFDRMALFGLVMLTVPRPENPTIITAVGKLAIYIVRRARVLLHYYCTIDGTRNGIPHRRNFATMPTIHQVNNILAQRTSVDVAIQRDGFCRILLLQPSKTANE